MQACANVGVTFRASRVDNETDLETERKEYPCLVIKSASGSKDTSESLFLDLPISLMIITHYQDDPKCTQLAELEDAIMQIITAPVSSSTVRTAFNSIALNASETWYYKGVTQIEGGMIEKTDKQQVITINMMMRVCGS